MHNFLTKAHLIMSEEIKVGIFWMINDHLISNTVLLSQSEKYGLALQHGGHWDYWEELNPTTHEQYLLKTHEYDWFPRGRVVFFPAKERVVVYADKCLWTPHVKRLIQKAFDIRDVISFTADSHYRCANCGGPRV